MDLGRPFVTLHGKGAGGSPPPEVSPASWPSGLAARTGRGKPASLGDVRFLFITPRGAFV